MFDKSKTMANSGLTPAQIEAFTAYPKGYISWPNVHIRISLTQYRLSGPLNARDPTDTYNFTIPANLDVLIGTNGVGGINTTQFPATVRTFYCFRLLGDTTGVLIDAVELIEFNTTPAVPAGYDVTFTVCPPIYVNSIGDFALTPAYAIGNSVFTTLDIVAVPAEILTEGNATVMTVVSVAPLLPVGERYIAHLNLVFENVGGFLSDSATISSIEGPNTTTYQQKISSGIANSNSMNSAYDMEISEAGTFRYAVTQVADALSIRVRAYTMSMRFD